MPAMIVILIGFTIGLFVMTIISFYKCILKIIGEK